MGSALATPDAFLDFLDEADRAALHERGRLRRYRRGDWLMRQGDAADSVVVLLEGRVKVAIDTPDGRNVIVNFYRQGHVVGEFEALGGHSMRVASVIALDEMRCRVFSREEFRDYLLAFPGASLALVREMIQRLDTADRRRVDGTMVDSTRRLAMFLLEIAGGAGASPGAEVDAEVPLAQHDLASLIGVSRNSVVRALTKLRSLGLVSIRGERIRIADPGALRRFLDR